MESSTFQAVAHALEDKAAVVVATQTSGPDVGSEMVVTHDGVSGSLGSSSLDELVAVDAAKALGDGFTGTRTYEPSPGESVEVFLRAFVPPPSMYIFGGVNAAEPLCELGAFLGYRVVVCDARAPLATPERFPHADEVVVAWPGEFLASAEVDARTCIIVLTHDPKFDVPALKAALASPAGYVGALGSRKTNARRTEALKEAGVAEELLQRIHAPIGLEIGATGANEIALAIAAEIVAERARSKP